MPNNKMLIDAAHPEETRVAMVRGNRVDEFDFESEHKTQLRGNIYLAKVTRVEPSLQAAFVDYGGNRHGFLAFTEIHPDYYQIPMADRQALLDAEAEDARIAAESENDSDEDEASTEEKRPARKRRSRRRGGKKSAANEENGDENAAETASDSDSAEKGEPVEEVLAESSDAESPQAEASNESNKEVTTTADEPDEVASDGDNEEDDSDDNVMAAENDGDDVVSEPAKKPRRRTSRPKAVKASSEETDVKTAESEPAEAQGNSESPNKEAEEEPTKKPRRRASRAKAKKAPEELEASASDSAGSNEEEPKKKPRRKTSRKKQEPESVEAADVEAQDEKVSEAPEAIKEEAEPKKTRRRTSRKAKSDAEESDSNDELTSDSSSNEDDTTANDNAEEGSEAKTEKKTRSRSRSRRRSKKDDDTRSPSEEEDDAETPVEDLGSQDALEEVPARRAPRRHYKIQEVIKRRQILLVQVVKEERGNKGAALTTYLSLAGRYSVLMPNTARGGGISRKITNAADRKRLKSIANGLQVPDGMGIILRTAGASRQPEDIQRDFEYLMRLWENVRTLTLESTAPCLVYEEGSLIKRSIRDLYDKDTSEILVAGEDGHREAKDFMTMLMPNHAKKVKLYKDRIPMFARMGVEAQLDAMLQPQVTLKSGGYLIIDQTEALVAIDVNSGRSTRQHSVEDTAFQTNLEAADEVARQLRLRDLAGLIVIDFIDMEDKRNVRNVEKRLKDALKNDRARIQVGRISHFGLMEMSRQRIRASVLESTTQTCPTCEGLGHVRAPSSIVLAVLRAIEEHLNRNSKNNITVKVSTPTALYLLNHKRENLGDLEIRFGVSISIATDDTIGTVPCAIERGEVSVRKPAQDVPVQLDSIDLEDDSETTITDPANETAPEEGEGKKKRRRRRRRKSNNSDEPADSSENETNEASASGEAEPKKEEADDASEGLAQQEEKPKKRRRSRKKKTDEDVPEEAKSDQSGEQEAPENAVAADSSLEEEQPAPRKTRRRKTKKEEPASTEETVAAAEEVQDDAEPAPKRRTTRRKAASTNESTEDATIQAADVSEPEAPAEDTEQKKKKSGWWQRKFF